MARHRTTCGKCLSRVAMVTAHRAILRLLFRDQPHLTCNIKHLVTGPEGNSEFCFPRILMFPETKSRETLRFKGDKIHCFPRDQSLSDLLYNKTKQKQILKTRWDSCDKIRPPSTAHSDHVQQQSTFHGQQ